MRKHQNHQKNKNKSDPTTVVVMDVWNHIDFVCKNYFLNWLKNTLYYVYSSTKSSKALQEVLEKKIKKTTKLKMLV